MKLSNESRWFLSVAEAHPDFFITKPNSNGVKFAKIWLEPSKPKEVGKFDTRKGVGWVYSDDI
jgi:hypothetical protein